MHGKRVSQLLAISWNFFLDALKKSKQLKHLFFFFTPLLLGVVLGWVAVWSPSCWLGGLVELMKLPKLTNWISKMDPTWSKWLYWPQRMFISDGTNRRNREIPQVGVWLDEPARFGRELNAPARGPPKEKFLDLQETAPIHNTSQYLYDHIYIYIYNYECNIYIYDIW